MMIIVALVGLLASAVLPRGHRWLVLVGLVLTVSVWGIETGRGDDGRFSERAIPLGVIAIEFVLVPWLLAVGLGLVIRRAVGGP